MKLEPIQKEITLRSQISAKSSQTLLEFLVSKFKYLNAAEWEERIASGKVKVNDRTASPGQPLRAGDEVAYTTNSWEEPEVNAHYRVVYEDSSLFLVSKAAPLPVYAIGAYFRNTLTHLIRGDRPEAQNYQMVHRLDSETSGLILFVKDKSLVAPFQKQWEGGVRKAYQAIVFGNFSADQHRLEAPIAPIKGGPIRMKSGVDWQRGKPAVTEFELLETRGGFSLLEARILTGRTHQIRVHLEHLGYPIVGDKLYSGDDETFLHFYENDWDDWLKERVILPRAALHACRLEFTHVKTGEHMVFEDPLPKDLLDFWNNIPKSDCV